MVRTVGTVMQTRMSAGIAVQATSSRMSEVTVEGSPAALDQTVFLGRSRTEVRIEATGPARCLLLGGAPFGEPPLMWWNFVAREREEIVEAWRSWSADDGRFGTVASGLARTRVDAPPWFRNGH